MTHMTSSDSVPVTRDASDVSPKVAGATVGAAAAVLLVWGASLLGVDAPPAVEGAVAVLLTFALGYLTPDRVRA